MVKKKGITSPMISLNAHNKKPGQDIFEAELEAAEKALNFAQKKVITIYAGYQPISTKDSQDALGRGMKMIERLTLKKTMKTAQPFLYHGVSEVPELFRNTKTGDTVKVPNVFTASANPIWAHSHTAADGSIIVIENALAIPVHGETPDEANYVFAPESELLITKVERQTVVYNSRISKNLTVFTVTM